MARASNFRPISEITLQNEFCGRILRRIGSLIAFEILCKSPFDNWMHLCCKHNMLHFCHYSLQGNEFTATPKLMQFQDINNECYQLEEKIDNFIHKQLKYAMNGVFLFYFFMTSDSGILRSNTHERLFIEGLTILLFFVSIRISRSGSADKSYRFK